MRNKNILKGVKFHDVIVVNDQHMSVNPLGVGVI